MCYNEIMSNVLRIEIPVGIVTPDNISIKSNGFDEFQKL